MSYTLIGHYKTSAQVIGKGKYSIKQNSVTKYQPYSYEQQKKMLILVTNQNASINTSLQNTSQSYWQSKATLHSVNLLMQKCIRKGSIDLFIVVK